MKPLPLLIASLLAVAACRPAPEAPPAEGEAMTPAARPDLPDADLNASLGELGAPPDFPVEAEPAFVGAWATDEAGCASRAWRFTAQGLNTPAGSVCRFVETRKTPQGYEIDAQCTAEGPEQADRIRLELEEAGSMRFESEAVADATLTSCRQGP